MRAKKNNIISGLNQAAIIFQNVPRTSLSAFRFSIKSALFLVLSIALIGSALASVCHGADVTLAWDASNDPGLVGYKLYYGTASGVYTTCVDTGNNTQCTLSDLLAGLTYYFSVTAYDGDGNESGYSDEITYTVPLADTDGDGVDDSADVFPFNPSEWSDNDDDGTGDNADLDDDNDGVADALDAFPADFSEWADTDGDTIGNNADTDDDNDGMPDEWETANHLDPLADDSIGDEDGDGISNLDEYLTGGDPFVDEASLAPESPLLLSPFGGETMTVTPQLQIDDFSDSDFGDTHARTQWQILQTVDDHCVFDLTSTSALVSLTVPRLILEEGSEYYWRARFYDNHGVPSDWSQSEYFATEYLGDDGDGNGVPDEQEVGKTTDLDKDGVFDYEQADIRCVTLLDGNTQLGISTRLSAGTADIISLVSEDPTAIGAGIGGADQPEDIPFGLINFKVQVAQPGDEAVITVYFSEPAPLGAVWYKYDPVESSWVDFSAYCSMNDDRESLQLTLTDGGEGDADGIANGVIVDPAGLVIPPDAFSISDGIDPAGGAGGGGGCFIDVSAARKRSSGFGAWYRAVQGREAAIGFGILMLVLVGRRAAVRLSRMIRKRRQLAVGARLRTR